jgi:cellulose synthase/poly-beta-1,6-N-acetylglucosamine synthase-like glycosyltransferase
MRSESDDVLRRTLTRHDEVCSVSVYTYVIVAWLHLKMGWILLDLIYYSFLSLWNISRSRDDENKQDIVKKRKCVEILTSKSSPDLKISIIIPSYNEERQIHSVLFHALHDQNIEIIVSDGGSKDSTIQIVEEVCSKYDNVKYLTGCLLVRIILNFFRW